MFNSFFFIHWKGCAMCSVLSANMFHDKIISVESNFFLPLLSTNCHTFQSTPMEAPIKFLVIVCSIFELIDCLEKNENLSKSSNCFRFTWLGPKYNSRSNFRNATCSDVIKGDKSVPCVHPLVVTSEFDESFWQFLALIESSTDNSNVPNMHYIWDEFQHTPSVITCQSLSGEACVKFSYKFNGASKLDLIRKSHTGHNSILFIALLF